MDYEKKSLTQIKKKTFLKGTRSEVVERCANVNKPGMKEHLAFGKFNASAKCWPISNGELRLLEEREIFSSEDHKLANQSKNKIN